MKVFKAAVTVSICNLSIQILAMETPLCWITLVSDDGVECRVPRSVAMQSPVIANCMENVFQEGKSTIVSFKDINSATLQKISRVMNAFESYKDFKHKEQLNAVERTVNGFFKEPGRFELYDKLLFLEFNPGIQLLARLIAKDLYLSVAARGFIKRGIWKDLKAQEVARYYRLFNCANIEGIDPNSYGFSVQEYQDYIPGYIAPHANMSVVKDTLDLGARRLHCLEGLEVLEDLTSINCANNQLTTYSGTFKKCINLSRLCLQKNKITYIDPEEFTHHPKLYYLNLEDNKLSEENKDQIKAALPATVIIKF